MSVVRLSSLMKNQVGLLNGERFIVRSRTPGLRGSEETMIVFESGVRVTFAWAENNPLVQVLGRGRLVTKIELIEPVAVRFCCPRCGGHDFGTSNSLALPADQVGLCHTPGCGFMWARSEDEKYFTLGGWIAQQREVTA